jgi:hypothetical protein
MSYLHQDVGCPLRAQRYGAFIEAAECICRDNPSATYDLLEELLNEEIGKICASPPTKRDYKSALTAVIYAISNAERNIDILSQKAVEECQNSIMKMLEDSRPILEQRKEQNRAKKEAASKRREAPRIQNICLELLVNAVLTIAVSFCSS